MLVKGATGGWVPMKCRGWVMSQFDVCFVLIHNLNISIPPYFIHILLIHKYLSHFNGTETYQIHVHTFGKLQRQNNCKWSMKSSLWVHVQLKLNRPVSYEWAQVLQLTITTVRLRHWIQIFLLSQGMKSYSIHTWPHINGLVQAMELCLSYTNPLIWCLW